ncbi:hypothetical protein AQUCO_08100003v1 [Aquilegia coerulea]|uniref:Mediator complex subunit 15 KIX domain-containing protein n=1 Tax=Aquilegia coerulea TaxID=218851 RepID=A0A2G5C7K1_AQUCA|nr:hypothetical protein AQUCO_08100003v1 [Aquilegia coerulea]
MDNNNNSIHVKGGNDDNKDWRTRFSSDSRRKVTNEIMETLKRHLPEPSLNVLREVKQIAESFEEKVFSAATSQDDYVLQVNMHLVNLENRSHTCGEVNILPSTSSCGDLNSPDSASQGLQSQFYSEALSPPICLAHSSQAQEKVSSHNNPTISDSSGVQSPSLSPAPSGASHTKNIVVNCEGQSHNFEDMSEKSVGCSALQSVSSDILSSFQGQMEGKQHRQQNVVQQQFQNVQQYIFQKQLPKQVLQGHQSSQNTLQQAQPSSVQSSSNSDNQQNQQSSAQNLPLIALQQQPQRSIQQQKHQFTQQSMFSSHQNQQLIQKSSDETNRQYVCNYSDMQPQQVENQQLFAGEQNNFSRIQQKLQVLGQQNDVSGFLQHSTITLQQAKIVEEQQKAHQTSSASFLPHQQQSQSRLSQQQVMSHLQTHQFQQQLGSQITSKPLRSDMNQMVHPSSSLVQLQNIIEHQKQLFQCPIRPEASYSLASNGQTNASDGREVIFQKLQSMKKMYLPLLIQVYKKLQTSQTVLNDKSQRAKIWLERTLRMLDASLSNIPRDLTVDKLLPMERQIVDFIRATRLRRNVGPQQQGQQQTQAQMQHTDNQMKTLMQAKNLKNAMTAVQSSAVVTSQHDFIPSLSSHMGVPGLQPNLMNTLQSSSHSQLHSVLGSALHSSQQAVVGSLQKIPMNATQQARNSLCSQNDMDAWKPKVTSLKENSNALQYHLKQQSQPRQMSHQDVQHQQVQQIIQQNHQNPLQQNPLQRKLQQSTELLGQQIPHLYQMNEVSNMQSKQSLNVDLGVLHQHQTPGRQSAYNEQSSKSGDVSYMSSPHPLQSSFPYTSQYSSPQTDQLSMISLSKSGISMQPESSPILSLSPSNSLTPPPILADHEKQASSISLHSNAGNCKQMQTVTSGPQPPSLVISTPGISASSLLTEFASPVNIQASAASIISSKTIATEKPIEHLIRVVKSMSHKALSASVSDIDSAVTMVHRMASSKPGNHSKDAIGEDLVATVKHRAVVNNFSPDNGIITSENMKYHTYGTPLRLVSSDGSVNDRFKPCNGMEKSDLESTATSRIKRPRVEFPVLTMCLLVSSDYPKCSPVFLDKLPLELSKEHKYMLLKAGSQFMRSIRCLPQPITVTKMARSWDTCAHAVILEYAVQNGGGSFSTRYGTWRTVSTS